MGPIHPRVKKTLSERLARAASAVAYGADIAASGPTIKGCSLQSSTLSIHFDMEALRVCLYCANMEANTMCRTINPPASPNLF